MALKIVRLSSKMERMKARQKTALAKEKRFKRREEELDKALDAAATEEEIQAVEAQIDALDEEVTAHEEVLTEIEEAIEDLQAQIDEIEGEEPAPGNDPAPAPTAENSARARTRQKFFRSMPLSERCQFLGDPTVKAFLQRTREFAKEKRAVKGGELNIPDVALELLRDNLHRYSKLIKHVYLRPVKGKARQTIAGNIPEGVWTEACAALNELDLMFNMIEVDGYKVGGFIPVCNATLEDSDINLASEILDMLGQAIGIAIDKAIIYGTGTKMPVGIATRIAQTAKPESWGADRGEWEDLRTTNLLKIDGSKAGNVVFAALIIAASAAKANYSTGGKWWAMNSTTYSKLMSLLVTFNAGGAIVASLEGKMPIIGGDIEILEFIPDDDLWGGYGDLFLLVERSDAQFAHSEHVRFIEDQTVFKGTARYDGQPVFGKGFVGINIGNKAVTTSVSFALDEANEPEDVPGE